MCPEYPKANTEINGPVYTELREASVSNAGKRNYALKAKVALLAGESLRRSRIG